MSINVYYNEIDPFCCSWLSNLMDAEKIMPGKIDNRSIANVEPKDLDGFDRCHFFAGIGVWDYALNQAGWEKRNTWTGSCPCQPFSAAGQRKGFDDSRHLWPEWFRLIRECHPQSIFGEQVGSALGWLDLVSGELEGEGYAVGEAIVGAHSVGAPHIRQRIYWVADSAAARRTQAREHDGGSSSLSARSEQYGGDGGVAHAESQRDGCRDAGTRRRFESSNRSELGNSRDSRFPQRERDGRIQRKAVESSTREAVEFSGGASGRLELPESLGGQDGPSARGCEGRSTSTSYWSDCTWLPCIDGKARPTQRWLQSMADGVAADLGYLRDGDSYVLSPLIKKSKHRVGRLRGYGNALVAPQAIEFVKAAMETLR